MDASSTPHVSESSVAAHSTAFPTELMVATLKFVDPGRARCAQLLRVTKQADWRALLYGQLYSTLEIELVAPRDSTAASRHAQLAVATAQVQAVFCNDEAAASVCYVRIVRVSEYSEASRGGLPDSPLMLTNLLPLLRRVVDRHTEVKLEFPDWRNSRSL